MKLPGMVLRICVSMMLGLNALAMGVALLAGAAAQAQEHVRLVPQLGVGAIYSVAFSPDGRLVLTSSYDRTARLWDAATGLQIRSFIGHTDTINTVAFSPDGRFVLTGSGSSQRSEIRDDTARLWNVATGQQIRSFEGHTGRVLSVAFSPAGRYVLTGSADFTARLWDAATGQSVCSFKGSLYNWVNSVAFSPDGRFVLTGGGEAARLWNAATCQLIRSFEGAGFYVAFSSDGRFVQSGGGGTAQLWDAATGQQIRSSKVHTNEMTSVAFSPDSRSMLTGGMDNTTRLWDVATGQLIHSFEGNSDPVFSVAFSPDGHLVLSGFRDGTARLWDAATGQQIRSFEGHTDTVTAVGFSPDGRFVLTGGSGGAARLWNSANGQQIRVFEGGMRDVVSVALTSDGRSVLTESEEGTMRLWDAETGQQIRTVEIDTRDANFVAVSPDGRFVLTGSHDQGALLKDVVTGKQIRSFEGHTGMVGSVAFSLDGRYVLTGGEDKTARLWNAATGQQIRFFEGHTNSVTSVAVSPDGRFVLTGSEDTTTRLWDAATGKELATLISFEKGGWAVTDPEGRFDTSDLDGGTPLAWVADSEPMRALPLEIFMRDYYTPGLLATIMNGQQDKLPPIRSIVEITNRVQPDVKVVRVTPSTGKPDRVDVVVHAQSHFDKDKHQASGLLDLRLFRDGQMVGSGYVDVTAACAGDGTPAKRVNGGYIEGALHDCDYTFRDVLLKSSATKVTFTAYAFNSERIKSTTATLDYESKVVSPRTAVKQRAFLLQIGVNHYVASRCDLNYSGNDAEKMSAALAQRLSAQGYDVQPVKLESPEGGDPEAAGKQAIRKQLAEIAAQATPDDVFFMSFSGHGYSAESGVFYILPSDIQGSCRVVDDALLKSAISADELAEWLRPIDAGEMTLILDACFSAESVQAGAFKPGPLGSRGLGQLAYDKRMRVLAASQSDEVAHEYDYLQEGLLTYVLTHDGLEEGKADWKPVDKKIMVGEWLAYAADAVPKFVPDQSQRVTPKAAGNRFENSSTNTSFQIPALFDFSKTDTLQLK